MYPQVSSYYAFRKNVSTSVVILFNNSNKEMSMTRLYTDHMDTVKHDKYRK